MTSPLDIHSTRPYLLRAIYEWCNDHHFTPYVAVKVDESVQVPREHVRNGEIVLNVSFEATSGLKLGNDFIEFKARFGGVSREIMVPMHRVMAIYALENGQGMSFPVAPPTASTGPREQTGSPGVPAKPALALAPGGAVAGAGGRVFQLVGQAAEQADEAAAAVDHDLLASGIPALLRPDAPAAPEPEPPPLPPTGAGARPTLKRVK